MNGEGERIARLEAHILAMEDRIRDLEADRKSLFRWGLLMLGSAVTGTIGILMKDHLR